MELCFLEIIIKNESESHLGTDLQIHWYYEKNAYQLKRFFKDKVIAIIFVRFKLYLLYFYRVTSTRNRSCVKIGYMTQSAMHLFF